MNGFYFAGKLLGYPECCINYFCSMQHVGEDVISHDGFIPCPEHAKLSREKLETLIGRSLKTEPQEFWDYLATAEENK